MLNQEKSGNPGDYIVSDNKDFVFRSDCLNQPQKRKNNKRLTDKKTERNVGDRREKQGDRMRLRKKAPKM
jgi:hypothetical protein